MHAKLLEGIPLFAGLSGDEKAELARRVASRDVPAGEVLFWIGDPANEFFIILSGEIAITCPDGDGREVTLARLAAGDFLGEISLLDGGVRTATARAHSDVSLICLTRETFHAFIRECPAAAIHMMSVLGRRQRQTVDSLRGVKNINEVMDQRLTAWQKIANTIAALAASPYFLGGHACAFAGWIVMNIALRSRGPDPFPFPFLCFWTSTEAIFLSLFILISQNVQSQKDRMRTEIEYQVALKTQSEIMQLHRKLDAMTSTEDVTV